MILNGQFGHWAERSDGKSMLRFLAGGLVAILAVWGAAKAAEPAAGPAWAPSSSADWTITIGAEGRVVPSYEGSNSYLLVPFPLFDIRRAGTPPNFSGPRDGVGFGVIDTARFRLGPTFKLRLPRRESDDHNLQGLGDVNWALEAGVFAEYWPVSWLRTRVELRQGFGGHHGVVSDLMADSVLPVTSQLTLSGGPRVTLTSTSATTPYFSITPGQSAASGLPAYDAGGGFYSFGAGVKARYEWSPQWATHAFLEYERLTGGAANSPIVTLRGSRDQLQAGIGAIYSFDMRALW
jgi:outer membrane protein